MDIEDELEDKKELDFQDINKKLFKDNNSISQSNFQEEKSQ